MILGFSTMSHMQIANRMWNEPPPQSQRDDILINPPRVSLVLIRVVASVGSLEKSYSPFANYNYKILYKMLRSPLRILVGSPG